ncbi:MAG: hypothetical protein AAGA87_12345 [Pseudomonadota bacterium]
MRVGIAALIALGLGTTADAYVSSEGHWYDLSCNASGYVLTSRAPVGRWFGEGAFTTVTEDRETIYLGRSCDAARTGWTGGTWCWANGGISLGFNEYGIGFPRQELVCPQGSGGLDLLDLQCGC